MFCVEKAHRLSCLISRDAAIGPIVAKSLQMLTHPGRIKWEETAMEAACWKWSMWMLPSWKWIRFWSYHHSISAFTFAKGPQRPVKWRTDIGIHSCKLLKSSNSTCWNHGGEQDVGRRHSSCAHFSFHLQLHSPSNVSRVICSFFLSRSK